MSLHELVSVVIPVYNSENFLAESIESVLNQTYKNIEIIAVDDGSTDKSADILKHYSEKLTIITQTNQGLAAALNSGIKKVEGMWIKWFSPDDILYPKTIEILVKEVKKLPENSIIYSNWELIDENNNKLRDFFESNYNDLGNFEYNLRLLDGQQINVNTTLIPTSLFKKGCVIRELEDPVAIDYDFFLRAGILFNTKFFLIEKTLLKYRIHSNQLSHKNISKSLNFISDLRKTILSQIDSTERQKYYKSLEKFQKEKPISKKTMEAGLKIISLLPSWTSDKLIVFYLNKIRRSR